MKRFLIILFVIILTATMVFASASCKKTDGVSTSDDTLVETTGETEENRASDKIAENIDPNFINANTDFALKIFKELCAEDKGNNVFISPLSISIAFAMVYNGSKNQTQQEIAKVLEFKNYSTDDLNKAFNELLSSMENIDNLVELLAGNSIWISNDLSVKQDFVDTVENSYNSSIYNVDFKNKETENRINTWISEATKEKIKEVPPLDPTNLMVLLNAIYFKGQWKDKFNPELTEEEDFFLANNNTKKVQMMNSNEKYKYFEGTDFRMLRLPYGRDKTAMYVLLPKEDIDINKFLVNLDRDLINKSITDSEEAEVELKFPKFNIEYGYINLVDFLQNLGMNNSFGVAADFSGISEQQIDIGVVNHKAVIEVNEEGTVAAAVSEIAMGATAAAPQIFKVNRPFILFIRDDRTGSILFEGKIMEP